MFNLFKHADLKLIYLQESVFLTFWDYTDYD